MTATLVGIRQKIDRAKYHLSDLHGVFNASIGARQAAHAEFAKHQADGQSAISVPDPPAEWALIIGDTVSNLRASLDHLACQLAILNGKHFSACAQTEFPIHSENNSVSEKAFKKIRPYLTPKAIAQVEFFQPYNGNNSGTPEDNIRTDLYRLAKLDNINKHRLLVVVDEWTILKSVDLTVEGVKQRIDLKNPVWQRLKDRTETVMYVVLAPKDASTVPADAPPPKMNVNSQYSLDIAFNETGGVCDHAAVFPAIGRIVASVTAVVDTFDKLFFCHSSLPD